MCELVKQVLDKSSSSRQKSQTIYQKEKKKLWCYALSNTTLITY